MIFIDFSKLSFYESSPTGVEIIVDGVHVLWEFGEHEEIEAYIKSKIEKENSK